MRVLSNEENDYIEIEEITTEELLKVYKIIVNLLYKKGIKVLHEYND